MSDESTQPAAEHHAGTLDLSGEGNRAEVASLIPQEAVAALATSLAWSANWDTYSEETQQVLISCSMPTALAGLEAAYPAIREQVAGEIAVAIGVRRDEITPGRPGWVYLGEAIGITRQIAGRDLGPAAPGSAGGASGRTGLAASPSDPPAGKAGGSESGGFEG